MNDYDRRFFDRMDQSAIASAEALVPLLYDLFKPTSVVDVGCGRGYWAQTFKKQGVADVRGVDGAYVDPASLYIDRGEFTPTDLATENPKLDRRFDLAICLETAEHLPESRAASLVKCLTDVADVVVFSAAVPFQTGQNHINCQWQSWWKRQFEQAGSICFDAVRPRVWQNTAIDYFYRQNLLVYMTPAVADRYPELAGTRLADSGMVDVVTPEFLLTYADNPHISVRKTLKGMVFLPYLAVSRVWGAAKRRLSS